MLSKEFTHHISNPRNMGDMFGFNGSGEVTGDECGDMMTVYIKVDAGRIVDIRFKTFGCWAAVAAGSMITESVKGLSLEAISMLEPSQFRSDLDDKYEEKRHCLDLVIDTIHSAVNDYIKNSNSG